MQFKISVIIPVYNGQDFIARAIESVLKQTYFIHEIIVINDGSKDDTLKVLENYKGQIITKTILNSGVSNARNMGIKISSGEWIAFLDSDDVWFPDKIKKQIEFVSKYSNVGMCCCNYRDFDSIKDGFIEHFSRFKNESELIFDTPLQNSFKLLVKENIVGTASTILLKKDVLTKTGLFNINYKQAEDYDLWLRCVLITGCICMLEVLVDKGKHEGNLTNNQIETCECHKRVLMEISRKYKDIINSYHLAKILVNAQAVKSYQLGDVLYESGDIKKAFVAYLEGLCFNWDFKNIIKFLFVVLKKIVRFMSFELLSRKSFRFKKNITIL